MRCLLGPLLAGVLVADVAAAGDLTETLPVEPGGVLEVRLGSGTLVVASHDADAIRVEANSQGWPWDTTFVLERDGRGARLSSTTATADGVAARFIVAALWPFHLPANAEVRAWVPTRYSIDAQTRGGGIDVSGVEGRVDVASRGGPLSVRSVRGDVGAETAGGPVTIADVAGDVRASTRGGPIDVAHVARSIEVQTRGGPIDVREAGGRVVAHTRGGPISVGFVGAPAGEVETRGGGIDVTMPRAEGLLLDAETPGQVQIAHDLVVDGETGPGPVVARVNGGGATLRLRTAGGSIRVEAR